MSARLRVSFAEALYSKLALSVVGMHRREVLEASDDSEARISLNTSFFSRWPIAPHSGRCHVGREGSAVVLEATCHAADAVKLPAGPNQPKARARQWYIR